MLSKYEFASSSLLYNRIDKNVCLPQYFSIFILKSSAKSALRNSFGFILYLGIEEASCMSKYRLLFLLTVNSRCSCIIFSSLNSMLYIPDLLSNSNPNLIIVFYVVLSAWQSLPRSKKLRNSTVFLPTIPFQLSNGFSLDINNCLLIHRYQVLPFTWHITCHSQTRGLDSWFIFKLFVRTQEIVVSNP